MNFAFFYHLLVVLRYQEKILNCLNNNLNRNEYTVITLLPSSFIVEVFFNTATNTGKCELQVVLNIVFVVYQH